MCGLGFITSPIRPDSPVEGLKFIVVYEPSSIFTLTELVELSSKLIHRLGKSEVPLYTMMYFSQMTHPLPLNAEDDLIKESKDENFTREFGDPLPTQHYLLAFF